MAKRVAYIVAVHPEDHSVDVVMADNGDRVTGVQVMAYGASERTGHIDLPSVPNKKSKWDITEKTGQDMKAVIDYVGRTPIVTGFLFPQINQMLQSDGKMKYSRHQSDVQQYIDGDGNFQYSHPSGTFIRVAEDTDFNDMAGKNVDKNAAVDRNTDKPVNIHIELAGQKVVLTLGKDGNCSLSMQGRLDIQAEDVVSIKSSKEIKLNAPKINMNKS